MQENEQKTTEKKINIEEQTNIEEQNKKTEQNNIKKQNKTKNKKVKDNKKTVKTKSAEKKPKKKSKKWICVIILIFLICTAIAAIILLKPNKKQVDFKEYFGLDEGISYGLIVNSERVGRYPIKRDGSWYLDFDSVYSYVSNKFYYDGEAVLYTNPTKTFSARPQEYSYFDDEDTNYQLSYQACFIEDDTLYLSLDYVQLMDYSYYKEDTDRQFLWIWNDWSERAAVEVKKDTVVRLGSSIKEAIVDEVTAGSTLLLLEEGNKWDMVQTEDGLIGCIQKSYLAEETTMTPETPDRRSLPIYTTTMLDETVIMAWHQVFSESGYDQLDEYLENAQGLNVISPTWITVSDEEGNIRSLAEKKYVTKAHRAGLQVWGMVDNINIDVDETQLLGVTAHRKHLIEEIMAEAERVGLDGINLDFEAVGETNGPHLLQFIRELSAACRKKGLVLSVDNYSPMPHTAFYDRTQQGEIVDYVIVMAYDEYYAGGSQAGSTSSISWVKQSAERTLSEVPKEKLIVGLPFYTRLWKQTPIKEGEEASGTVITDDDGNAYTLSSSGVGMTGCVNIITERSLTTTWLEDIGQYYVEYEEDGSEYFLWIEDETSMALKLKTAFSYEPAGVAFFKIGLETDDVWVEIKSYAE